MKLLIISLFAFLLVGCSVVPVSREFPKVPDEIKASCPDLKLIDEEEKKLSIVIGVVAENYGRYHECKIKVDLWIEWYNNQKKIFESVK